jgi:hypothetical protein
MVVLAIVQISTRPPMHAAVPLPLVREIAPALRS